MWGTGDVGMSPWWWLMASLILPKAEMLLWDTRDMGTSPW